MANRTVRDAHTIHGKNPQNLVEKVIRNRIYESKYWKEECFALTAELLVDKACDLKYIGGVVGGTIIPTPFICLLLKMLQIQPDKDIVIEFIKRNEFKYCRALGALYLRLTGESTEIYKYLETLYNDYSKLKRQIKDGSFAIVHMDEFIDELLRNDAVSDVNLPRLQKRHVLESINELEPRISILDEDLQEIMLQAVEEEEQEENRRLLELQSEKIDAIQRRRSPEREKNGRRYSRSRSDSRSRDKVRKKSPRRDHKERRPDKRDRSPSVERRDRRRRSKSPERRDRKDKSRSPEKSRIKREKTNSPDRRDRRERHERDSPDRKKKTDKRDKYKDRH